MRFEPDLDRGRLLELLRDRYGLEVSGLAFVPLGIDSWSYVATCRDGSGAFVKLRRRVRSTKATPSEVPLLAALAARHVAVPRPMADHDGGFLNSTDGYEILVLEYIDGHTLEGERTWPDDLYARVARTVAAVHASTSAVSHLVGRVERYELPFLTPLAETLAVIEARGPLPGGEHGTLPTLHAMVAPRMRELREATARLEDLCDQARRADPETVLCHTDIWGSNLLRTDHGTLHLVDWDGALLGPPECDLFMFAGTGFFPADRFGWFLDRYERAFRRVRLDADTFGFYLYRRTLEDLASFVGSIAEGRLEAMAPDAMLGIVADLLAELPRLEGRIEHVTRVLGQAHPTSR